MFVVKTIKISKNYSNQNHIVLLFDTSATVPCLYPLLYSTAVLRFQSFATQQSEPYRVCRRVNILRDYPDDKIKIYP